MLHVLNCVLLTGMVKLFLEVENEKKEKVLSQEVKMSENERESVCAVSVSHNVKE